MPTRINTGERDVYTNHSLQETLKLLSDGKPIVVWWFDTLGEKYNERIVFTEFNFLSETVDG